MIVRGRGAETIVEKNGAREVFGKNAVEFLREYFRDQKLARRGGLAPLSGGAVGYLGYDAARWFEPVLDVDGAAPREAPHAVLLFFPNIVTFDRAPLQMDIMPIFFTPQPP